MRTAVVGAGPTGLYLAIALARRGHAVTVVDRDPGPRPDGSWDRRGVMQFHHPHGFRPQVVDALTAEMPEVWDDLVAAGAEAIPVPGTAVGVASVRCRRLVFERVLRRAAEREPGVSLRRGHVDEVLAESGRAAGIRVDGGPVAADLVLDASGRSGRFTRGLRAKPAGGDCGIAYVSQQHRLLPGAELGPLNSPIGMFVGYPGYLAIVFPHDNRTLSTLVVRASGDREMAGLRDPRAFAGVLRAIPALATWTEPDRSRPISQVMPGGHLYNSFCGQLTESGTVPLPGLFFVGDAVCTTNPQLGRGVSTSLMQARRLVTLLDSHGQDYAACALAFDAWCSAMIRPWFEDHVYNDQHLLRRWGGADVDLTQRLPSDLVVAATEVDPSMMPVVGPYLAMHAQPDSLDAVQPRAREIYASGWRPSVPAGPSRDELAALVAHLAPHTRERVGQPVAAG